MNKKIMEAMEYMDEKYIGEALDARKKASSRKTLMRWGTIAACLVLVVGLCVGMLGGLPGGQQEKVVLPPTRYGAGQGNAMLARTYTIEQAVAEADAVAWVRVGNWIGERPDDGTFFEAEVIRSFRGDMPEDFTLKQLGSSLYTLTGYPLFTSGNELLLFLNKADLAIDNEEYENCYIIMGAYSTVMDVTTDENGDAYVSDRYGMLGKTISAKNYGSSDQLKEELTAAAKVMDDIQSDFIVRARHVYALEELAEVLNG